MTLSQIVEAGLTLMTLSQIVEAGFTLMTLSQIVEAGLTLMTLSQIVEAGKDYSHILVPVHQIISMLCLIILKVNFLHLTLDKMMNWGYLQLCYLPTSFMLLTDWVGI